MTDRLLDRPVRSDDLIGPHTRRGVEVMGISGRSLGSCPPLLRALAQVKVATARANGDADVLRPAVADAVVEAARAVARGDIPVAAFPADLLAGGGSIAVHMNINEVIATLATDALDPASPVDAKADVAASQSTADVCHTAARLAVLDRADALLTSTAALSASLDTVADRFDGVTTLARTCLQDGLPAPLSTVFRGAAEAVRRRSAALDDALAPLNQVVLGTTVIGRGDGAPAVYRDRVVGHLVRETGRPLQPHPAPASALQHGDDLVAVSSAITQLSHPLVKLGADLRLLGSGPSGGFGEVLTPDVLDGSSFFTDKRNPVVAETLVQAGLQVQGLDHTVQLAAGRAELYLQVLDGLVAVNVLDEVELLAQAIDRLDRFVLRDLVADPERCAALAATVRTTR